MTMTNVFLFAGGLLSAVLCDRTTRHWTRQIFACTLDVVCSHYSECSTFCVSDQLAFVFWLQNWYCGSHAEITMVRLI